ATCVRGSAASAAPLLVFNALYFGYYFLATGAVGGPGDAAHLAAAVTFVSVLAFMRGPVIQLAQFSTRAAAAAPAFDKVRQLLESPEVTSATRGRAIVDGSIEFDRVSFRYAPEAPLVLNDVSFRIESGRFTAIVGQSGSGKTTLFHL